MSHRKKYMSYVIPVSSGSLFSLLQRNGIIQAHLQKTIKVFSSPHFSITIIVYTKETARQDLIISE